MNAVTEVQQLVIGPGRNQPENAGYSFGAMMKKKVLLWSGLAALAIVGTNIWPPLLMGSERPISQGPTSLGTAAHVTTPLVLSGTNNCPVRLTARLHSPQKSYLWCDAIRVDLTMENVSRSVVAYQLRGTNDETGLEAKYNGHIPVAMTRFGSEGGGFSSNTVFLEKGEKRTLSLHLTRCIDMSEDGVYEVQFIRTFSQPKVAVKSAPLVVKISGTPNETMSSTGLLHP